MKRVEKGEERKEGIINPKNKDEKPLACRWVLKFGRPMWICG